MRVVGQVERVENKGNEDIFRWTIVDRLGVGVGGQVKKWARGSE